MSKTDIFRVGSWVLFFALIIAGGLGYFIWDKDPAKLTTLFAFLVPTLAIGEGANVGKRATFKKDAL